MSSPHWTDEQLEAITARDCNLLVAAAAGAGKTAVLVERIIRRITDEKDPVDVDRLLVVTFTKAAASEMKERISAAIVRELNKNPDSHHLSRQLTLLNRASITTLHSFCLEILRQYFYRLELDPVFRVAEDTEAELLRLESLEELFEDKYASGNEEFLALVDAYGGDRGDSELQKMVLQLHEFSVSSPWPEEWLKKIAENYICSEGLPLENLPWGRTLMRWIELELRGCRVNLERACKLASLPGGPDIYLGNLADDLALIDDLIKGAGHSWQLLYDLIKDLEFGKLKPCRNKDVDKTLLERVKKIRDNVKKSVYGIRDNFFFRPPGELVADLKKVAPLVKTLTELVIEFAEKYQKAKAVKSLVDFSDLEHFCLKILMDEASSPEKIIPSTVACQLREHFVEVLVDEYQDINAVQETVLQLVSRDGTNPNRFMVGDVKQSIYRFRLAEPGLFLEKYNGYPREKGGAMRGIDLAMNFRSRREIVDAVNFIFRQLMTVQVGEMAYDAKAELVFGADYPSGTPEIRTAAGPVELYLLERNNGNPAEAESPDEWEEEPGVDWNNPEDELADLDAVQREARLVARRIQEMVCGKEGSPGPEFFVLDKKAGGYRPVQYRDIVVLLRTTRNMANTFLEEFCFLKVPAYAELGTGYFEATEVETMIALLKIIDNPRQDIPLAAVLRSPIVGLKAGELAAVRLREAEGDFYDAVCKSAELGENEVDLKLRDFLARVEEWRTLARRGPLSELIWRLYNETGYYSYVGGMPGGAQRQANLRFLYDRALQYERTTFRGLFRFLRFIEKFRESGSDLGLARALGENEDVVRILSIHKSKGLEFPVVIVAGLGKQFNTTDLKNKALLHKELGLGLQVVERDFSLTYPSIVHTAIKKRLQMELLAEEMRILYVALTRAREKLILVGSVKELEKATVRWCENVTHDKWPLPDIDLSSAKTYLDWIGPAVARHPDGGTVRKLAKCDDMPVSPVNKDPSCWQIFVPEIDGSFPVLRETGDSQKDWLNNVRELKPVNVKGSYETIFDKILGWQYPDSNIVGKPAKVSVTELKRRFAGEFTGEETVFENFASFKRPGFLQEATGLTAQERGSVMHLVMQHLKPHFSLTEEGINEQLKKMVDDELLTGEQAATVDLQAIKGFFTSPLGQRLMRAVSVKKEVPFTMVIPVQKVYPGLEENYKEQVLVQGVIDCLIDEGDGYVILDYKTDQIAPGQLQEVLNRYRGQLDLYAEAVEVILKKPVKEKYLYLFALGHEVKCG